MTKATFSKQEIKKELRWREHLRKKLDQPEYEISLRGPLPDENCIHCGQPFKIALASAGEHGLCDTCLHSGD